MIKREGYKRYCSIIFLLLFLNGCAASTTQHKEPIRVKEGSVAVLAGGVQKVVDGQIEPEDMVDILTERFLFALGGGTFGPMEEIGETMLLSGQGYVKTSSESEDYKLLSGNNLKTPFLVGVDNQAKPKDIIYVDKPKSIQEIYRDLSKKYDFFAIVGIGDFEETVTTALKKAPIYGESIIARENRSRYFHPVEKIKQVSGVFVGIVQDMKSAKKAPEFSKRMFYNNFANTTNSSEIQSHTHIAFLDASEILPKTEGSRLMVPVIPVTEIKDVQHLLPQSRVQRAMIMVYSIAKAEQYQ